MTPLLACFPVCMTFVAIGIVGAIVVAFGMYNQESTGEEESETAAASGRPPLWVLPLMMLAAALVMLALAWYWPE
jgi:hypothetical protein